MALTSLTGDNEEEEYVYIIDAANVAYCRQNFEKGKFSFPLFYALINYYYLFKIYVAIF